MYVSTRAAPSRGQVVAYVAWAHAETQANPKPGEKLVDSAPLAVRTQSP